MKRCICASVTAEVEDEPEPEPVPEPYAAGGVSNNSRNSSRRALSSLARLRRRSHRADEKEIHGRAVTDRMGGSYSLVSPAHNSGRSSLLSFLRDGTVYCSNVAASSSSSSSSSSSLSSCSSSSPALCRLVRM
ncbi:unnamed protein product [Soboliphyme baturini]|uniref:Uncharacterized protein n=1 Tax=Soboliphyme baturini TaxID=241478 RepID=A0A183IVA5_9BILA|nr:unnamed protein product [Soboliphyme baturini]